MPRRGTQVACSLLLVFVFLHGGVVSGVRRVRSREDAGGRRLEPQREVVWDSRRIETEIKPAVVSITHSTTVKLYGDDLGVTYATGFIVDAKRGIIATNRHVTGVSPSTFQVSFYDGSFLDARVLWYDPFNDFGFLKVVQPMPPAAAAVVLCESYKDATRVGDPVLLVGNNEGEEFTTKSGKIVNLARLDDTGRGVMWQTSFDRTGGASGSPVFNQDLEVVAIHAAGTDTTSLEIPIGYLARALRQLQARPDQMGQVKRGATGAILSLQSIGKVARYFSVRENVVRQLTKKAERETYGSAPSVPVIDSIAPLTPAVGRLFPGDVVYKIGGRVVGQDLLAYEFLIDDAVGGPGVDMVVLRHGQEVPVRVPVMDLETQKPLNFLQVDSAIFQELDSSIREGFVGDASGIWCGYSQAGTSFDSVASSSPKSPGHMRMLLRSIDGVAVNTLDDLRCFLLSLTANATYPLTRNFPMVIRDYFMDGSTMEVAVPMTLTLSSRDAVSAWHFSSDLQWEPWRIPPQCTERAVGEAWSHTPQRRQGAAGAPPTPPTGEAAAKPPRPTSGGAESRRPSSNDHSASSASNPKGTSGDGSAPGGKASAGDQGELPGGGKGGGRGGGSVGDDDTDATAGGAGLVEAGQPPEKAYKCHQLSPEELTNAAEVARCIESLCDVLGHCTGALVGTRAAGTSGGLSGEQQQIAQMFNGAKTATGPQGGAQPRTAGSA